jgi:anti-sigma B factor antagonist
MSGPVDVLKEQRATHFEFEIHDSVTLRWKAIPYTHSSMAMETALSIEKQDGTVSGTRVIRLHGPMTLRNIFTFQAEVQSEEFPGVVILDLKGVPYMDSAGMGSVINYYVHREKNKARLIVAGVSPRVMELFKMTKVDSVISLAASVEAAEAALWSSHT